MVRYFSVVSLFAIILCVTATYLSPYSAAQDTTSNLTLAKEDEAAIRKVVLAVESAWNSHDMKAYEGLLREDAAWVNIVGMHWRGREAVVAAHVAFHKTMFKDHNFKTDSIDVRPLGEDTAIAVVTTTNDSFTTPDGHVMPKAQNRLTYVMARGSNGWKIAHGHNVVVNADAAQNDPVNQVKK